MHDHLCEQRRLVYPAQDCKCVRRAYDADPFPEQDMPIYAPADETKAPYDSATLWGGSS